MYLLWEAEDEQLLWASSNDQGTTWSKPKKVDIRGRSRYSEIYNTNDYAILYPTIAASQVGALALYEERGVFYQWLKKGSQTWSLPKPISRKASFQLSACAADNHIFVTWADTRYIKRSWWDFFPLNVFLFDADPFWANSDLFIRSVAKDVTGAVLRLTPPLSFVSSESKPALSCGNNGPLVFWSGRKKVGKTRDAYGYPVQIFFQNISL